MYVRLSFSELEFQAPHSGTSKGTARLQSWLSVRRPSPSFHFWDIDSVTCYAAVNVFLSTARNTFRQVVTVTGKVLSEGGGSVSREWFRFWSQGNSRIDFFCFFPSDCLADCEMGMVEMKGGMVVRLTCPHETLYFVLRWFLSKEERRSIFSKSL